MILYHGSDDVINVDSNRCIYLTPNKDEALEYNSHFLYAVEVDTTSEVVEEDFEYFDGAGYSDYNNLPEVMYNPESGYRIVKHPKQSMFTLIAVSEEEEEEPTYNREYWM